MMQASNPAGEWLTLREFVEDDYERFVEILNLTYPDYRRTAEQVRYEDGTFDTSKFTRQRFTAWLATDPGEVMVGWCEYRHQPWTYVANRYEMQIFVDPAYRLRRYATVMWERIREELFALGAAALRTWCRETMTDAISFLEKLGFGELFRAWESRLDLHKFDPALYAHRIERLAEDGIMITNLPEERALDPQCLEKLHQLHNAACAQMPLHGVYTPSPLETFVKQAVEHPQNIMGAFLLAKKGDIYVGYSNLRASEGDHVYQEMTATDPEYRRWGIATALKTRIYEWARANGYPEVWTWNDSTNEPMLHVNMKMGFVQQPSWISFELKLEEK